MSELLPTPPIQRSGAGRPNEVDSGHASPERIMLDDGVTVVVRPTGGILVVELSGIADGSWVDSLVLELLARGDHERMVIDLNGVTVVNPSSLCQVIDELIAASSDPHRICLVCERLSAVVLLRRCGASEMVAIFGSTSDAIQAAVHHAAGYGAGWEPLDGR
ncbi:MAG: anti-sigma factor antagonist [Acidimicrobiia bacterium]|nr:anti-sigma factor antagonist [Acidimicrobiia bacterium]